MTTFNEAVYDDPKIKKTLDMLAQGKSREEIITHFNNKNWSTIDMYFRRKGFRWSGNTFEPVVKEAPTAAEDARFMQTKAAQVVRQLTVKHADMRQIAVKNGFSTVEELGEYMKSQGYAWDHTTSNYVYDKNIVQKTPTPPTDLLTLHSEGNDEGYEHLLKYLLSKKDRLLDLLETEYNGTLPRYKFKGAKANKTLGLPTSLQALLIDFSKEFNVTQRDIIEVSLAEFFQKYGYDEQLSHVLLT